MTKPLLFLTGFGAFEDVDVNPSGRVVELLAAEPALTCDLCALELPVTFHGSGERIEAELAGLAPRRPDGFLSLGVHRGPNFRLERRARRVLASGRPDNDGVVGETVDLGGPEELTTLLDVERLAMTLRDAGAREVTISDDAGGYVCERVYRKVLEQGAALDVPALFLHVPPISFASVEEQLPIVRTFVESLARQLIV